MLQLWNSNKAHKSRPVARKPQTQGHSAHSVHRPQWIYGRFVSDSFLPFWRLVPLFNSILQNVQAKTASQPYPSLILRLISAFGNAKMPELKKNIQLCCLFYSSLASSSPEISVTLIISSGKHFPCWFKWVYRGHLFKKHIKWNIRSLFCI